MSKGWIGVDLDRTLAHHAEGTGAPVPGEPIRPMVARVKRWLEQGHDVRIFTARVQRQLGTHCADWAEANRQQVLLIDAWCSEHLGRTLPITNCKDMHLWVLFDDRACHVTPNTGDIPHFAGMPQELMAVSASPRPKCRLTDWVNWCPCHGYCL